MDEPPAPAANSQQQGLPHYQVDTVSPLPSPGKMNLNQEEVQFLVET
jgi:hypothetical protein